MPRPDEGGIEAGLGRAAQPPTPTSSASNSSSRLQQPSPRSGSSCSAAELRQLEWDSSFDFTARYQPSRADGEPTERSEARAAPGPSVTATQQAQIVSAPAPVFAETEVNLVVASADSSRSDRTGSTVITLRRQVSFPTISLKRSAGALDGLRGLTILFEGGEQPDTAGSEASFCSLAPTEPQQPAASRHASRLSQQTEYASLSERLSSASAASHPAPPQPPQQQTGRAAMSRPPRTPAPPPPPLASRAPPSIEKCARWLARHELQVGHGDGTGTGPTAAAATIAAADGAGRARGAWRSRIQPCSSQDRVVSAERNKPQPDYRPVVTPAEPRRAADTGTKRSPATARKALSDPLGGSAQSAGAAGSAAAAVRPQPAAKSRSAHAGTAAGMTRQQHAESLARRPRPPPVAAAASRSYTETATAPSVPSLHYLDSAESDELIRRWRQDRKDFYQLAYLRRGDSDVLSPADDSGFSSSVLTQRHVSEQQVQVFTVSAVKTTPSAVPAASAASKLGPAQGDSAPVAAGAMTPPTQQEQVTVLVPPRDEPPSSAASHQAVPAATPPAATPPQTSPSTAAGPVPSRSVSTAASSIRAQRPQTAPAGGRPRPVAGSSSRRLAPQPSGVSQRRSAAAPAGSVRFSPSTQSAVGRASAAPVTPRPSAAAVRAPPSRLGRTRSSTFTMPEKDEGPQEAAAAAVGSNRGVPATRSSANSGAPGSASTLKPNPSGAANGGAMSGGPTGRPSGKVSAVGSSVGTSGSAAGVRSATGVSASVVRPSAGVVGSSPVIRPSAGGVPSSPVVKSSAGGVRSSTIVRPSAGGVMNSPTTKASAGGVASSPAVRPSVGGVGLGGEAAGSTLGMRPSTGAAGSTPVVKPSSGPGRSGRSVHPSQGSAVNVSATGSKGSAGRVPSAPSTPATAATDSPRSTSPSRVDSSRSSRSNLVSSTSTGSPRRLSSSPDRRRSSLASSAVPPAGSSPTVRPSTSPTVRPSAVRRGSLRVGSVLDTASRMERSPTAGSVAAVRTQSRGRGTGAAGSTATSPSVGVVPQAPRPLSAQPEPNMRRNQPPPRRYSFTPSTAGVGGSRTAAGGGVAFQASRGGETGLRPSRSSTGTGGQTYRRESAAGEQSLANPSRHSSAHVTRPVSGSVGTAARSTPAVRTSQHASSSSVVPAPSPEMHVRKSLVNREIESGSLPRLRSVSASRSPDPCRPPLRCDETPPPGSPERGGVESDEGDGDGDRHWAGDIDRGRNMDRNRGGNEDDGDEYRDREEYEDEQRPGTLGTAERQWSRKDAGPTRGYSGSFRRSVDEAQLPLVRDTIRDYEVRSRSVSRERVPIPRSEPRPEMVTRLTLELETDREPGAEPGAEPELGAEGDDQGMLPESDTELDTELEPSAAAVRYSTDGCAAGDEESASDGGRQTPAVPPLTGLSPPDSRRPADPADPDPYHPGQWRQQHEPAPRRPHTRSRIPVRRPTPDTPSPRQSTHLQPAQRQQQATPQRPQYASYELTVLAERSAGRQRSPPPRRADDYQPGRQARPGGPPRRPRPPPQGCPDRRPPPDHPRASRGHSDTTIHPRASTATNVSPRLTGTPAGVGGGSQRSVRSVRSAPARRGPSTPRSDRSTSSSEAVYTLGFSEAELRQARLVRRQPAGGRPLRLTLDGDGALEGGRAVVRRLQHTHTQTDEFAHVSSLLQLDLFPCQRDAPGRGHADT